MEYDAVFDVGGRRESRTIYADNPRAAYRETKGLARELGESSGETARLLSLDGPNGPVSLENPSSSIERILAAANYYDSLRK